MSFGVLKVALESSSRRRAIVSQQHLEVFPETNMMFMVGVPYFSIFGSAWVHFCMFPHHGLLPSGCSQLRVSTSSQPSPAQLHWGLLFVGQQLPGSTGSFPQLFTRNGKNYIYWAMHFILISI